MSQVENTSSSWDEALMETWRKVVSPDNLQWTGLTRVEAYQLEKDCLDLLEKNYECLCGEKSRHFPVIMESIDSECTFTLSYCGECVLDIAKSSHPYKITNLDEQVDCIIHNLRKSGVKHLDMHPSGKNLCISPSNTLVLVDFDLAAVNDHFPTPGILSLARTYGRNEQSAFDGFYDTAVALKLRGMVMAKNLHVQIEKVVE